MPGFAYLSVVSQKLDGAAAPLSSVSAAARYKVEMDSVTNLLQATVNGGAWTPFVFAAGGVVSMQNAYDGGGAVGSGAGRAISTMTGGAVTMLNAVADATNCLELTRNGAASGGCLTLTTAAAGTGSPLIITRGASTAAASLASAALIVNQQSQQHPSAVFRLRNLSKTLSGIIECWDTDGDPYVLDGATTMLRLDGQGDGVTYGTVDASTNNVQFRNAQFLVPATTDSGTRGLLVTSAQRAGAGIESNVAQTTGSPDGFLATMAGLATNASYGLRYTRTITPTGGTTFTGGGLIITNTPGNVASTENGVLASITHTSGALATADTTTALAISVSPGVSGSASGVSVTMGANATGPALSFTHNGQGSAFTANSAYVGAGDVATFGVLPATGTSTTTAPSTLAARHIQTYTTTSTWRYAGTGASDNTNGLMFVWSRPTINGGGQTLTLGGPLLRIEHSPQITAGAITDTTQGAVLWMNPATAASAVSGIDVFMGSNASGPVGAPTVRGVRVDWAAANGAFNHYQGSMAAVGHTFTEFVPATVFFSAGYASSTAGGLNLAGFSDSDTTGAQLAGYQATSSSITPAVSIQGWKSDGVTGRTALTTTDLIFGVYTGATSLLTLNATGQMVFVGTAPTTAHILGPAATFEISSATSQSLVLSTNGGTAALTINSSQAATLATTLSSGVSNSLNINATSTTAAQDQVGIDVRMLPGHVGTNTTMCGFFYNTTAGRKTLFGDGNLGANGAAVAVTVGNNVGVQGSAGSGDRNFGVQGIANTAKAASNVAVIGLAQNASGPYVAGYFALEDTTYPTTFPSAALVCNNSDVAADMFVAQDGGPATPITVFRIADGGGVGIASVATTAAPTAPAAGQIQWGTGGAHSAGTPNVLGASDEGWFLTAGTPTSSAAGNALTFTASPGLTSGAGGAVNLTAGAGAGVTTGIGGAIVATTGAGVNGTTLTTATASGAITLTVGTPGTATTGTAANPGTLTVTAVAGGAASDAAGIGGNGNSITLGLGVGGASSHASSGVGGNGGTITIALAGGGASTGSTGGNGASFVGSSAQAGNGVAGGTGCSWTYACGKGGDGTTGAGGPAGAYTITSAAGGNATAGTGNGGAGSDVIIGLGKGGTTTGGTAGRGGIFSITFPTVTGAGAQARFDILLSDANPILRATNANALTLGYTGGTITAATDVTFDDAKNLIFNTTTGTKFGTATTQKMGWWNAAPVVQPTAVADAGAGAVAQVASGATSCQVAIDAILSRLRTLGIFAT